jgi:NAD(P)-dependent dehydrogenase (short-subunit alcohol dehydrogenase family)
MNINFKGHTAIVTGATQGIGKSIATMLVEENCRVIYTGRSDVPTNEIPGAEYEQLDLCDQGSIERFINQTIKRTSGITILVNNAGIQIPSLVESIQLEDWDKTMAVNITGPMKLIQAVVPYMKENKYGRIVNVSSVAGIITKSGQSAYSASKSGILGLTRTLGLELAQYNILVNAICPGTTATPMVDELLSTEKKEAIVRSVPMGRLGEPDEIAYYVLFLASRFNSYMTGQSLVIDGGYILQ